MKRLVGVAGVLTLVSPVLAQVDPKYLDTAAPRINDASYGIAWGVALCFALGVLAVAFKNSKRSHLE